MRAFHRIEIDGFRRLKGVNLELRPLCVLIGANGAGKTSFLKPEEVIVVDMNEDGNASLTWADQLDLDQWLQEYTLDEVWRMGRMGGRR
jgi:predicted ATPase